MAFAHQTGGEIMNADPDNCTCERCDIDRERAPHQRAWLRALHEATTAQVSAALDAVENGSHCDSPEANGGLLALTGLMMEQERELSGAVVARAAREQDEGEQSPTAAAEFEQRIGLMGRLNHAAARLRRQSEREGEGNDAALWYAACFACTSSLEVVRLFRRRRAELSRLDLMWEACLVVLAPLMESAKENRERLEYAAVPDIGDGLADARATLLAEAHAAIDEMTESVAADLREFNQDLPVEIRPAMQALPVVAERAVATLVGPADFHVGRFEFGRPAFGRVLILTFVVFGASVHVLGPQPAARRGRTLHRLLLPRRQGGPVDAGHLPDGIPFGRGSGAGGRGD